MSTRKRHCKTPGCQKITRSATRVCQSCTPGPTFTYSDGHLRIGDTTMTTDEALAFTDATVDTIEAGR